MKDWKSYVERLHPHLLAWIWSVLFILQVILALFVFTDHKLQTLENAGWAIWVLGGVFGILPIFALRKGGGVPEGKSYMATTTLVDTGIYAIVRHPQSGTAGILLNLALALIGQHWLLAVLAVLGMALLYIDTFRADAACIDKFGQGYVRYMERVPRVNFVTGSLRLLLRSELKNREV